MIRYIGLAILILLNSCAYTKRTATTQVAKAQAIHPEVVAAACAAYYPPLDSIITDIQYLPGEPVEIPGPVKYVNCDSIVKGNAPNKAAVAVPCPPSYNTTDTFIKEIKTTVVNRAKEKQLESRLNKYQIATSALAAILLVSALFNLFQFLNTKKNG